MSRHSENQPAKKLRRLCLAAAAAATLTACSESSTPATSDPEELAPEASAPLRTVYVSGAFKVAAYNIKPDGSVSSVPGSPYTYGTFLNTGLTLAEGIALTPDARYAYAFRSVEGIIHRYKIQPDGGLSQLAGDVRLPGAIDNELIPIGGNPFTAAITPDGRFLYTPSFFANRVFGFRIGDDGSLTPMGDVPIVVGPLGLLGGWTAIAIAPDGHHLYLNGPAAIISFSIADDGKLTQVPGSPFPSGHPGIDDIHITPNGRYLYASDYLLGQIVGYSLDSNGGVTRLAGGAASTRGLTPQGIAISPDGRRLYTTNIATNTIAGFDIGEDGSLTHVPGSPFLSSDTGPSGLQVTPDGRHVYVAHQLPYILPRKLSIFAVADDGSLSEIPDSPVETGVIFSDFQPVAVTPNQGPTARLRMSRRGGLGIDLDASGSTDPDGSVASYEWDFGDGQTQTGGAKVTHSFERSGVYFVSVAAVDNEGCSDRRVFTGRIAMCNGGPRARVTLQVRVGG